MGSLLESFSHFKHRKMMFHKNFVVYLTLITIALTNYTPSLVYANSTNANSTSKDYEYEYPDDNSNLTETRSVLPSVELEPKKEAYYCKYTEDYQICRRCPDIDDPACEKPNDPTDPCICDNIAVAIDIEDNDEKNTAFIGGPDCLQDDSQNPPYCYINEASTCSDKKIAPYPNGEKFNDLWHTTPIYESNEACKNKKKVEEGQYEKIGNEKILIGIKISTDFLLTEDGKPVKFTSFKNRKKRSPEGLDGEDDSAFDYDYYDMNDNMNDVNQDYKSCSQQCSARKNACGAWSYDAANRICYLHNVKSCCGQRSKHEKNGAFISGYVCKSCWSTYNDCPCSDAELQGIKVNGTAHSLGQGAEKTIFTSSAALLQVDEIKLNPDLCAWIPRYIERKRKWKNFKPRCSTSPGGCNNPLRCRPIKTVTGN